MIVHNIYQTNNLNNFVTNTIYKFWRLPITSWYFSLTLANTQVNQDVKEQ